MFVFSLVIKLKDAPLFPIFNQWENDLQMGSGEMTYANGDKYNGEWELGQVSR